MALWGDKDNISVGTGATAYISSYTKNTANGGYPVVGSGSSWGLAGYAQVGDIIRFGDRAGTYYGDAVINAITGTGACFIASTESLSPNLGTGVTTFTISQLPKFETWDPHYSRNPAKDYDSYVYGISTTGSQVASGTAYEEGVGWVGVTTYNAQGTLRVKKEILVSMSGIATGNLPTYPPA